MVHLERLKLEKRLLMVRCINHIQQDHLQNFQYLVLSLLLIRQLIWREMVNIL